MFRLLEVLAGQELRAIGLALLVRLPELLHRVRATTDPIRPDAV